MHNGIATREVAPSPDKNEHGGGYHHPPGLSHRKTNPSVGHAPTDFANIAFTDMERGLDKTVNATDEWPKLKTDSSTARGGPGSNDPQLEEVAVRLRDTSNAPPEFIDLVAQKFHTRQESARWGTFRAFLQGLRKRGSPGPFACAGTH